MSQDPRSHDVGEIIRQLAGIPGSEAVSVTSRRFARFSPAEQSAYREDVSSYPIAQLPESVEVGLDSDEIVITLHGQLRDPEQRDELVERLEQVVGREEFSDTWESRAELPAGRSYALTVFTAPTPARDYSA